jgi:hypothetical protein
MVSDGKAAPAYLAAAVGGALLWLAAALAGGKTEAWDSSLYWVVAYPAAIVLAAVLGYWAPHRAWRWGLTIMLVQAVVLTLSAADFTLLPLGLILFAILALPPIGAAGLAARISRRRATSPTF